MTKDAAWKGPVIIKSDLNFGGLCEAWKNDIAKSRGHALPYPDLRPWTEGYTVLSSIDEVEDRIWSDESAVVERFIPEPDERGFAKRTWVFMGDRERCTRSVSPEPIIKGVNVVARTPSEVPEALRVERARLGFDYGKFDFVIHDGVPVLFDANRTPSAPGNMRGYLQAGNSNLAEGLQRLIAERLQKPK